MTRFEYLDALRNALEAAGLPSDVAARTVADYEKRIFDASAAGQREDDIMAGLEDPKQVAESLRAEREGKSQNGKSALVVTAPRPMPENHPPRTAAGVLSSFLGLMVFNLFLIIPAAAYVGLLIGAFALSLACYVGGIAITGASVAGVNQLSLADPFNHVYFDRPEAIEDMRHHDGRTVVNIGEDGIHVEADGKLIHVVPPGAKSATATVSVGSAASTSASASMSAPAASAGATPDTSVSTTVDIGPKGIIVKDGGNTDVDAGDVHGKIVDLDLPGVHIHNHDADIDHDAFTIGTDFISASQPVQIGVGIGIILAGIVGFLLCLTITRYTWLGVIKLAQLEFGVLRGA